ncbi:hypothetical protein [Kitasatospora sp. NBC_01539]|uniref:hypothetical protein n=1 Tax=Kitasatospora sp. NBC_01539 TaxID=2903577 RepID=UPI0038602C3A
MVERRMSVATHWGSFVAVVDSGRLVRIEPRGDDPAPSPIGPGMVTAADDGARVLRPAVRKGWLNGLPRAHTTARVGGRRGDLRPGSPRWPVGGQSLRAADLDA